jgi:signal peptidase II
MSRSVFVAIVAGTVLIVDQISKWYIRQFLPLYGSIPIVDSFFHITHVRNSGGAFSLLADAHPALRLPFFVIATTVAVGVLIHFLRQLPPGERLLTFALSGILGGAVGNFIDRVTAGYVTDFFDAHWRQYHWPAFNVADSFISIGVTILIAHSLFASHREA